MSDREYFRPIRLADWLSEFAKRMQKNKKTDEFDDIREIYKAEGGNFDAVEAKVREIRERAGLDTIQKESSLEDLNVKLSNKEKADKIVRMTEFANRLEEEGLTSLAEQIDARVKEKLDD